MTRINESIIDPIDVNLIKSELTKDCLLRTTKSGSNELYIFDYKTCPNTLREIGRLRELSFRDAGGGTGRACDLDEDDLSDDGYMQLIVWDPAAEEIIGGYRYIVSNSKQTKHLSTEHYFKFSDKFREEYLPYMIELGRSFVQPKYQGRKGNPKGIFALDNLWEGIGAISTRNPHIKYLFGKVTMYVDYNLSARSELMYFLKRYFCDSESLLIPIYPIEILFDSESLDKLYCADNYIDNYKILSKRVREHGETIPPLVNAYMNLSPSLKVFDTVSNPHFGGVEETGMLITIEDIYATKYDRYIVATRE
ncbi:MAG: GNAT family N-acetyltransferase [Rikenellaceae bacterium]